MIIYLAPLICLIGLIVYLVHFTDPKVNEVGRIMFWVGLLVTLMQIPNSGPFKVLH